MSRFVAVLVALGIGLGVITAFLVIVGVARGEFSLRGFAVGWPILLAMSLWTAAPFLILALARVTRRAPWFVGLALTLLVWGFPAYELIALDEPGRDANLGLGLLMLGAPLIIAIICVAIAFASPKRDSSEGGT